MRMCSIEGCKSKHEGIGYCSKHRQRFKRYGSPHIIKEVKNKQSDFNSDENQNRLCDVKGCKENHKAKGFCRVHYLRFFKNGNTDLPKRGTHQDSNTRLYSTYNNMVSRCERKNNTHYKYYGGRGVKISNEWNTYIKFKSWALNNGYEDDLTIDRMDNNGNYEPSNCRWITQSENTILSNKLNARFTYDEKIKNYKKRIELCITLEEMGKLLSFSSSTLAKHEKEVIKKEGFDKHDRRRSIYRR